MKNRAKCKLCHSIIESYHETDYVPCKCGHISVSGGLKMECSALDWSNFLRVDDLGNEIVVQVIDSSNALIKPPITSNDKSDSIKPNREELLKMLDDLIESFENMPTKALNSNASLQDLHAILILMSSIFRS